MHWRRTHKLPETNTIFVESVAMLHPYRIDSIESNWFVNDGFVNSRDLIPLYSHRWLSLPTLASQIPKPAIPANPATDKRHSPASWSSTP